MPRKKRVSLAGVSYLIANRGVNGMAVFCDPDDYAMFRRILIKCSKKFRVRLSGYSMTPMQFRLVLSLTAPNLSEFAHGVQASFARYFAKKYRWKGHVWQGRFRDVLLTGPDDLRQRVAEVEADPVVLGLVQRPQQWPHSSYRSNAKGTVDSLMRWASRYFTLSRRPADLRRVHRNRVNAVIDSLFSVTRK